MNIASVLTVLCGFCVYVNTALATNYDGSWNVEVDCPASAMNKGAREVKFSFKAQVIDGELSGGIRSLPEPGSIRVKGKINDAGQALIHVEGYHNNPDNNVRRESRGTIYTYSVRSNFGDVRGKGERIAGRECNYNFTKSISQ